MEDPEAFLKSLGPKRIVLDEVHRLDHPTELLKIAADHYPQVKVLATGSSTLGASVKFKDTLTGRKVPLFLTPMILEDLTDFRERDLHHRLIRGGLPPFFLSDSFPERDFQEWLDSFWAKDIQELFRLERRNSFQKFIELLLFQSGGIFEANSFARPCEVSRGTIANYLKVLEATFVTHIVRPFSTHKSVEIVSAPKVYALDTGFISYFHGWKELHQKDLGLLWEHFVLNEIQAHFQTREVHYWRDKRDHEVDFVLVRHGFPLAAIECKWSVKEFDPLNLRAFRHHYPESRCLVIARDVDRPFSHEYENLQVEFVNLHEGIKLLDVQNGELIER